VLISWGGLWAISNRTPYGAERNWTRDKHGVHWWIVAVKATYHIGPNGVLKLANEQPGPLLVPEYFGAPGDSSLRYDSDLLALKAGTDVTVLADAHAPGGRAAATVPVSIRVGGIEKDLLVHGDRVYIDGPMGLTTSASRPFVQRPIRYEFAYGGKDLADPDPRQRRIYDRNPVGRGFTCRTARLAHQPAHCVEFAGGGDPSAHGQAGFGPIDPSWMPRRKYAGTYDERWSQTKSPLLPDDYDARFGSSAPADQRSDQPLAGNERVALVNLTPEGKLVFGLPQVSLAFTSRFGRRRVPQPVHLATVIVETEELRLSLVWQSALRVPAPEVDYLDQTEIVTI
jgi:hypothetical protein